MPVPVYPVAANTITVYTDNSFIYAYSNALTQSATTVLDITVNSRGGFYLVLDSGVASGNAIFKVAASVFNGDTIAGGVYERDAGSNYLGSAALTTSGTIVQLTLPPPRQVLAFAHRPAISRAIF